MRGGSAGNPGDSVQITRLIFKEKEIFVDINGGSKKGGKSWRDRIEVGVSGSPRPQTRVEQIGGQGSGTPGYRDRGATLILDFGAPIPRFVQDFPRFRCGVVDAETAARVLSTLATVGYEMPPPGFAVSQFDLGRRATNGTFSIWLQPLLPDTSLSCESVDWAY